jgi:hypothetical protein
MVLPNNKKRSNSEDSLKDCCLASAHRYLKRNRDVASCDHCKFLLMAYTESKDFEEALKNLRDWGGEFSTARLKQLRVVAKARVSKKRVS